MVCTHSPPPPHGGAPSRREPNRSLRFLRWGVNRVRGGLCRKENLVCVVGVDVLGDPCDQRDRRAVGVEKESVFVGETISLPQATCLRSIQNAPMMGNGVCARTVVRWRLCGVCCPLSPTTWELPLRGSLTALSVTPWACHLPREWEAKVASRQSGTGFRAQTEVCGIF